MKKCHRNTALLRRLAIVSAVLLSCVAADARLPRNSEERAVARLVEKHPQQGRPRMTHDAYLHLVARARAKDMAKRNYFGHTDPDGYAPNRVLNLTGYGLPDTYILSNNIESITAGTNYTPSRAFQAWLNSPPHRRHILADGQFYEEQSRYGVGYAKSARSRYKHYYVFLSAPPSTNTLATVTKSLQKLFLTKTPRQIDRSRVRKR